MGLAFNLNTRVDSNRFYGGIDCVDRKSLLNGKVVPSMCCLGLQSVINWHSLQQTKTFQWLDSNWKTISYHFGQNKPIVDKQEVGPPVPLAGLSQSGGEPLEYGSGAEQWPQDVKADDSNHWWHESEPSRCYVPEESGHSLFEHRHRYVRGDQSGQEEEVTDRNVTVVYELCG